MGTDVYVMLVRCMEALKKELANEVKSSVRFKLIMRIEDIKEHIMVLKREYAENLY